MTEKRFRVFPYLDGSRMYGVSDDIAEYTVAYFDNDLEAEHLCDLLNELAEENEQLKHENEELKKENQGIQNKVIKLLDFVEVKQCVTRIEIKKWWNND